LKIFFDIIVGFGPLQGLNPSDRFRRLVRRSNCRHQTSSVRKALMVLHFSTI
jgi:hypothetical protein